MLVKINRKSASLDNVRMIVIRDKICLIDEEDAARILRYKWKLKKSRSNFYAVRAIKTKGKEFLLAMHRQIKRTPRDKVEHHRNRCTLDNRKKNLETMNQHEHHLLHEFGT